MIELYKHFYPLTEYASPATTITTTTGLNSASPSDDEKVKSGLITNDDTLPQRFTSDQDLLDYATRLSSAVLDTGAEISMAALQGFLLKYKKYPKGAVLDAGDWARGIKGEQDEKVRKKEERRAATEAKRGLPLVTHSE